MRLWIVVALVACDSGESNDVGDEGSALEGVYAVDSYAENAMGCDVNGASDTALPFSHLEISALSFMGAEAMLGHGCDDAAGCDGGLFATYNFETFDDSSASGVTKTTSYASGACFLQWNEVSLTGAGGGITVTEEVYRVQDVPGADLTDCTDQQDAWTDTRSCDAVTILEATPL